MMMYRYRRTAAVFLATGSMCALAACGSSSSSSSGSGSSARGGFKLTASEQACLKKHGVTIPSGGRLGGRPPGANGTPPSGAGQGTAPNGGKPPKGKFPKGKLPKGKFPRGGFGARSKAQLAAFKACGVNLPSGGPSGGRPASTTAG